MCEPPAASGIEADQPYTVVAKACRRDIGHKKARQQYSRTNFRWHDVHGSTFLQALAYSVRAGTARRMFKLKGSPEEHHRPLPKWSLWAADSKGFRGSLGRKSCQAERGPGTGGTSDWRQ